MHVVASRLVRVCPLVEYLFGKMDGSYYQFEQNPPQTDNGILTLPDRPGFGIEYDQTKIERIEAVTWQMV